MWIYEGPNGKSRSLKIDTSMLCSMAGMGTQVEVDVDVDVVWMQTVGVASVCRLFATAS